VVRHPILAILPVVVLIAAALAIGFTRHPSYTTQARLSVGSVNVPAYTLETVIQGNSTLASSYARTIDSPSVVNAAARSARVAPAVARDGLSATAVPGTTLIRIDASGSSEDEAVRLANAGARAVTTFVAQTEKDTAPARLLRQYRRAQLDVDAKRAALRSPGTGKPDVQRRARVDLQTAELKASNLGNQYRDIQMTGNPAQSIRPISPAVTASSDRMSTLERLLLVGAAAGLVLGLSLALLSANWARLRR
jgi:hypothetical protein